MTKRGLFEELNDLYEMINRDEIKCAMSGSGSSREFIILTVTEEADIILRLKYTNMKSVTRIGYKQIGKL